MSNKARLTACFLLVALVQLAVPASMIVKRQVVLDQGERFLFRTAPVDPYDAFRGRYVALRTTPDSVQKPANIELRYGQRVYVALGTTEDGFARFDGLMTSPPDSQPFLTAKIKRISSATVTLKLPFDRYYMNEKDAPAAEIAYRSHSRGEKRDAHIAVRIKNGFAVLEELYVSGQPIAQFLAEQEAGN